MLKKIQNLFFFFFVFLFFSCDDSKKITITKVNGSPSYENAKLSITDLAKDKDEYSFLFDSSNYELGIQTPKDFDYQLANSDKGQHIHFIVNNDPYSAHYSENVTKKIEEGDVILAFLSRSYHESVKNPNAFVLTEVGDKQEKDLSDEFLFYSRPKGKYVGEDTKKLLLDFYLVNTNISKNGNKVKVTINQTEFIIDEWAPYYIEGLPKGEINIKLELINSDGNMIETLFNPSTRTVILE
jgi:hypothetical protein